MEDNLTRYERQVLMVLITEYHMSVKEALEVLKEM